MIEAVRKFYEKSNHPTNDADIGGNTLYDMSFDELRRIGEAARVCTEQAISDTIEISDE